jgi:hypothetical protein
VVENEKVFEAMLNELDNMIKFSLEHLDEKDRERLKICVNIARTLFANARKKQNDITDGMP